MKIEKNLCLNSDDVTNPFEIINQSSTIEDYNLKYTYCIKIERFNSDSFKKAISELIVQL